VSTERIKQHFSMNVLGLSQYLEVPYTENKYIIYYFKLLLIIKSTFEYNYTQFFLNLYKFKIIER